MSAPAWIAFLVAAAVGASARHLVGGAVHARVAGNRPLGTFLVNASGSFLLGVVTGLSLYHGLTDEPMLVIGTGFCGAYTTFSTFTVETIELVESGDTAAALRNVVGSAAVCLAAAGVGLAVTAW